MVEYKEKVQILHAGDADYPDVMRFVPEYYDIIRVGKIDCVPRYQIIDKLQEQKCISWHKDEETGEICRECEG